MKRYFILLSIFVIAAFGFTNHLEGESSPYLKQHLHNPVDWYPWGEEAFAKARREHKPIFLSIGYSTCHWCHVMARESFENPEIAESINRWFVPVKVDREEMPHLDRRFQRLYTLLHHRSGGWPLTVFLTEEGKPFFIATYLPPEDGYGVEGLSTLVPKYGRLYREHPEKLEVRARAVEKLAAKARNLPPKTLPPDLSLAKSAVENLWRTYDKTYDGWGERPKFPESAKIRLLLDIVKLDGNETARRMALRTLRTMADSGLYDQIDGGFFRYCVDRAWTMPHFEKMLYTNAELIPLYTRAWRMSGEGRFRDAALETVREMDRRFRTDAGLYMSASDADSDHVEGGYFLYRYRDALAALMEHGFSRKVAIENLYYLDIREEGNFDTEFSQPRRLHHAPPPGFEKARAILKAMRKTRTYPFIDRKIITAWNGMMLEALFVFSDISGPHLVRAEESYAALKRKMAAKDGTLYHQSLPKERPTQPGLLEDYAFMAAAALAGYRRTLRPIYLQDAARWADTALEKFYEGGGKWVLAEEAPGTPADLSDRYYTSPLSKMLGVLTDLALLESDLRYDNVVKATLAAHGASLQAGPEAYPEATRIHLRRARGIVGIKGPRQALLGARHTIETIDYPYLLLKAEETEGFTACDMQSCFGFGKTVEEVKEAIEKYGH